MANRTLPDGLRVRYEHDRRYTIADYGVLTAPFMLPTGGQTIAVILDNDNNNVACGVARCRPDEPYVRKIGQDIALGRALVEMSGEAERRRQAEAKRLEKQHGDILERMFKRVFKLAKSWDGFNMPMHEIRARFLRAYDEVMR